MKNTLSASHAPNYKTVWVPGVKGVIGGFNVNISLSQQNVNQRTAQFLLMCHGYAWLSREQLGSQSRGICCVLGLPFRLPRRGWNHGAFSVCATFTGTASPRAPEKWTEDAGRDSFPRTSENYSENHEVAEELGIGRRAGRHHLYLCLSYDCSHRHPTGGWVLICFGGCYCFLNYCNALSAIFIVTISIKEMKNNNIGDIVSWKDNFAVNFIMYTFAVVLGPLHKSAWIQQIMYLEFEWLGPFSLCTPKTLKI